MVIWKHGVLKLPDSKVGQRTVPLSPQALARLRTVNLGSLRLNKVIKLLRFRDPAAERIEISVLDAASGRLRVTGSIRNRGTAAFEGRDNQAGAYLYRDSQLVAHKSFGTLGAGEQLEVHYDFNGPGGDIPPSFKLMIGYDPDILNDGNTNNDDMVTTNNSIERSINLHEVLHAARN